MSSSPAPSDRHDEVAARGRPSTWYWRGWWWCGYHLGLYRLNWWWKREYGALQRSLETGEAYWFWTLGSWDVAAGFFKGFGLGFNVQRREWGLTLGPLYIGGVNE